MAEQKVERKFPADPEVFNALKEHHPSTKIRRACVVFTEECEVRLTNTKTTFKVC